MASNRPPPIRRVANGVQYRASSTVRRHWTRPVPLRLLSRRRHRRASEALVVYREAQKNTEHLRLHRSASGPSNYAPNYPLGHPRSNDTLRRGSSGPAAADIQRYAEHHPFGTDCTAHNVYGAKHVCSDKPSPASTASRTVGISNSSAILAWDPKQPQVGMVHSQWEPTQTEVGL